MPHIVVKLYPGRTEEQKKNIAKRLQRQLRKLQMLLMRVFL